METWGTPRNVTGSIEWGVPVRGKGPAVRGKGPADPNPFPMLYWMIHFMPEAGIFTAGGVSHRFD